MKYYFALVRMAIIKKSKITNAGEGVEKAIIVLGALYVIVIDIILCESVV